MLPPRENDMVSAFLFGDFENERKEKIIRAFTSLNHKNRGK